MQTYLVGGAVRDKLLGREPKDRDYVIVGATGDDVIYMLGLGYQQVGADFPVFLHPETGEEYALARVERKTGPGYHGFDVSADSSVTIEEDLARRDLTINSMAMDENGLLIDPFSGLMDLHNHILRHTTDAFAEDPLRVLRLARFAARFDGWTVAPATYELCKKIGAAGELNHLTVERVWVEMEKAFSEKAPHRFFEVLKEADALAYCDSLRQMFASYTDHRPACAKALACVPVEQRLYVAIGVLSDCNPGVLGGPVRASECWRNVGALMNSTKDSTGLLAVLKQARAIQNGVQFSDLVMAATVMERGGYGKLLSFSSKQLLTAQHIILGVRAADFSGVEGKELGEAIENKRVAELSVGLSIPKHVAQA